MKVNGEAVYGTKASPFGLFEWGRCTKKESGSNTTLYLSVFQWPENGKLVIPSLTNEVIAAKFLASGQSVKTQTDGKSLVLNLPPRQLDTIATVIKVELKGKIENRPKVQQEKMKAGELH